MLSKDDITSYVAGTAEVAAVAASTVCSEVATPVWVSTTEEVVMAYVTEAGASVILVSSISAAMGSIQGPFTKTMTIDGQTVTATYYIVTYGQWVYTGATKTVCTYSPAIEYVAAVAAQVKVETDYGWNAGGNSLESQSGDCVVTFTMQQSVGVAVGLTTSLDDVGDYTRIAHGWYFSTATSGAMQAQVIESGQLVGAVFAYDTTTTFQIRRVGTGVTYWRAGKQVRASSKASSGEAWVGASLYASGDTIP